MKKISRIIDFIIILEIVLTYSLWIYLPCFFDSFRYYNLILALLIFIFSLFNLIQSYKDKQYTQTHIITKKYASLLLCLFLIIINLIPTSEDSAVIITIQNILLLIFILVYIAIKILNKRIKNKE